MTLSRLLIRLAVIILPITVLIVVGTVLIGGQMDTGWEIMYRVLGDNGQAIRGMDIERGLSYTLFARTTEYTSIITSPNDRYMLIGENDPISADQQWLLYDRDTDQTQLVYTTTIDRQVPLWSPDGQHFVYYDAGFFHIYALDASGQAHKVTDVDMQNNEGAVGFFFPIRWLRDGQRFQVLFPRITTTDLVIITLDGTIVSNTELNFMYRGQSDWSPDGQHLLYGLSDDRNDIDSLIMLAVEDGTEQVIYQTSDTIRTAYWSWDGQEVAVVTINSSFGSEIHMVNVATQDSYLITAYTGSRALWADWSPTSAHVFFPIPVSYISRNNNPQIRGRYPVDLFVYGRERDEVSQPFTADLSAGVRWSPDGSAFVFQSAYTGQLTVYNLKNDRTRQITDQGRDYAILP